jgi:REP element-mobilizing transposase RayT
MVTQHKSTFIDVIQQWRILKFFTADICQKKKTIYNHVTSLLKNAFKGACPSFQLRIMICNLCVLYIIFCDLNK